MQRSFPEMKITFIICLCAVLAVYGCGSKGPRKPSPTDSWRKGTIIISADESFQPVIDSHIQVFEASNPEAKIRVHYKPEAACLEDLSVDSIRMVIVTRYLDEKEAGFIKDSFEIKPQQMLVAYDAIAVIVHPEAEDTLFTMEEIKQVLTGRFKKNLIPVFDGLRATSTVRFIIDSVLRGDTLTAKATAAQTSEQVIEYVARTPDAVGFIGVSWIGNPEDPKQQSFLTKVRMAELESTDKKGAFIKPWQANIYTGRYPMIRKLIYILKEGHMGLGHGFGDFMTSERGQLIFRRAYLLPARMQFVIRNAAVRDQ